MSYESNYMSIYAVDNYVKTPEQIKNSFNPIVYDKVGRIFKY